MNPEINLLKHRNHHWSFGKGTKKKYIVEENLFKWLFKKLGMWINKTDSLLLALYKYLK